MGRHFVSSFYLYSKI